MPWPWGAPQNGPVGTSGQGLWDQLAGLYWASALGLGVVAFGLELALGDARLVVLGGVYLVITLALYFGPRWVVVHLLYAVASTIAMLHFVPQLPLAGETRDFASAILVLAVLALGLYGGPLWGAVGAVMVGSGFPGLGPYQRVALLGVHGFSAYMGVRIRSWLAALAAAFLAEAGEDDRFFRTGGDEFVGLHRGKEPPRKVIEGVRRRFAGVSVGVAPVVGTLEATIAAADRAMYRDKRRASG